MKSLEIAFKFNDFTHNRPVYVMGFPRNSLKNIKITHWFRSVPGKEM